MNGFEPVNSDICKEVLPECQFSMFLGLTSPLEISKLISGLKNINSLGFNGITAEVLRWTSPDFLGPIVSDLINQSVSQSVSPDYLKIAKVTRIPKRKIDKNVSNVRPISVLPGVSNFLERTMYSRVYSYFERFNLFKRSQVRITAKKICR